MTQNTPIIGSGKSGLEYRNLDNDGKQALLNHHKGATAPTYAEAGCIWLDDSATPWVLKIFDGTDWVDLSVVDIASDVALPANIDVAGGVQSYNANNAVTDTAQEYSKAQNFNATTLTDAVTIAWDLESNQVAEVTLTTDRVLDAPANQKAGATYILIVKGAHALAFNSVYKFSSGEASTLEGAVNILTFVSDGTNMYGVAQNNFS